MIKSYFIQRLLKNIPEPEIESDVDPAEFVVAEKASFYSDLTNRIIFGAKEITGEESETDIICLLSEIFRFDYMGSYEFTNVRISETVRKIAKNKGKYFGWEIMTPGYFEGFKQKSYYQGIEPIYIICKTEDLGEITKRLILYGREAWPHHKDHRTREAVMLNISMADKRNGELLSRELSGWLELDNGYFFFIDKNMFEQTCKFFGIRKMENVENGTNKFI